MNLLLKNIRESLPPVHNKDLLPLINKAYKESGKIIIILDDDPTGTQTSYNVPVLTQWGIPILEKELCKKPLILFILTNSRSLPEQEAVALAHQIGKNLKTAMASCNQDVVIVSRSDSTLRGHFPAEVSAVVAALDLQEAIWVLIPAFIEGGRFTVNDVHYILDEGNLIPVAQSPFAQDQAFGYANSNLKEWVEEKSKGKFRAKDVVSVSLAEIRGGGPEAVCQKLLSCHSGEICIVNAIETRDLEVLALGSILAEQQGKKFVFRSSATFLPIRAGIPSGEKAIIKKQLSNSGSLTIVGSYVPKTTVQLNYLISKNHHLAIEIDVYGLLNKKDHTDFLNKIISEINEKIKKGIDVVIFTSRELAKGDNIENSLKIHGVVSEFLIQIIHGIYVRPSFIIAKGGITASDIAVKGLLVIKAMILGQILPGIPVWELGKTSKFPELTYVVFPGNVGEKDALWKVYDALKINH